MTNALQNLPPEMQERLAQIMAGQQITGNAPAAPVPARSPFRSLQVIRSAPNSCPVQPLPGPWLSPRERQARVPLRLGRGRYTLRARREP